MIKTFIFKMFKWAWAVFVGCSVSFFLFYLIMGRVIEIKILGYVALALWLLGLAYIIAKWVRHR